MRSSSQHQPARGPQALRAAGLIGVCVAAAVAGEAQAQTDAAVSGDGSADHKPGDNGVVVTGVRSLMGSKLPRTLKNTPQSVTVVSQKLLEEQGIDRLQDALKNVPGITLNAGEGAARGDTVNLRGFSAFNDFFLDGIRDAAVYSRDSFNLQSVEVIKGPSATLFGRGSTGGVINQVSKAASLNGFDVATAEFGSNDEYRGTVDVDHALGDTEALRLNAMAESSHVAERDDVRNSRWGIAPTLALGLGTATTVTFAYLHQQEDDVPDTGIPFINGRPAPVDRTNFYGLISDRATADDDIATVRVRHDFNSSVSLDNTLRYANYVFGYQFDAPNLGLQVVTPATPFTAIGVGRDSPSSSGTQTNLTDQLDLTSRFDTGPLSHTLVTGVELARQTNDLDRYTNPFNTNNNWIPETSLLDPNPNQVHPHEPVSSVQDTTADSEAVYATDTIAIGPMIDLIAGLRFDRFAADYVQTTLSTGARLELKHVDNLTSPRVALVFKPTQNQSYYVSYGTSFDPSAEALSLTTKTANLGPVRAETYEVGGKSSWLNGGLLLTGAIFRTEVDNAQTNDPDSPSITVLNGNERVDGLELGLSGYVTPQLEINAGYTYLDGKTIASGTAAYVGKVMPNLAHNAVNLWAEYDITHDWEVGFGGNYLGHRFADSGQTANVPAYVVWNAMTSYRVNDHLKLQLNAINLFDTLYYDAVYYTSVSENHAIPGAGRTVKLTLRAGF